MRRQHLKTPTPQVGDLRAAGTADDAGSASNPNSNANFNCRQSVPAAADVRHVARVRSARGGIHLHAPYVAAFVAELKTGIPKFQRRWLPGRRAWWIAADWADDGLAIAERHYRLQFCEQSGEPSRAWVDFWLAVRGGAA
jgi:hypothetical protein